VSVGFPQTKSEVDSRAGQLSLTLRDTLVSIRNFKAFLDTKTDTELQNAPFSYSAQDVPVLRSGAADLAAFAARFVGLDHTDTAVAGFSVGETSTATATTATTLTRTGAGWNVNAWAGRRVYAASGVYGVVLSNTATVLTIDAWTNPGTITTGATPSGTTVYVIEPVYDYRTFAKQFTGVL
jgi:hypothetical protein